MLSLAIGAESAQFDDLVMHLKAVRRRTRGQRRSEFAALDFERLAAFVADEELALVRLASVASSSVENRTAPAMVWRWR